MAGPTEIRTKRLLLRPFRLSDIDDVLEYGSDPEWSEFFDRPYDRRWVENTVARAVLTSWDKHPCFAMEIDGKVVGMVELSLSSRVIADLSYEVARQHWGKGLAPEAARAVVDWGFREIAQGGLACKLPEPAFVAGDGEDRDDTRGPDTPGAWKRQRRIRRAPRRVGQYCRTSASSAPKTGQDARPRPARATDGEARAAALRTTRRRRCLRLRQRPRVGRVPPQPGATTIHPAELRGVHRAPDEGFRRGGLVCLNSAARFDKWNHAAVR